MVKKLYLFIFLITIIACDRGRIKDVNRMDENFAPSTTPFDLVNLEDNNICFYQNNFIKLIAQNISNTNVNWYKLENNEKIFLSSETNLIISSSGIFECKIKSENLDTAIFINLKYCPTKVEFPDFFKPNSTNFSKWRPIGYGVQSWFLTIQNRKKDVVYESGSFENTNWDGKVNNSPAPAGTYQYYLTGTFRSGFIFEYNGTFELVR